MTLHLVEYYTSKLLDMKYKLPSIKNDVDLFVTYYLNLAHSLIFSGLISDCKYVIAKGSEMREHFITNSQLSKVPKTPSGDPEEFNNSIVLKQNRTEILEQNKKQLNYLTE